MVISSFKYPIEYNENGGLKISHDVDVKRENIKSLLDTLLGERVMNGGYGIPLLLFESINNTSLFDARIEQLLTSNVNNITVEVKSNIDNNGNLLIIVNWSYKQIPTTVNTLTKTINL